MRQECVPISDSRKFSAIADGCAEANDSAHFNFVITFLEPKGFVFAGDDFRRYAQLRQVGTILCRSIKNVPKENK